MASADLGVNCKLTMDLDFEKWEPAIGKLILACSRIEYELMRLYEKHMPDRDFHADSYESRFNKSIGVAKKSLENGDYIAEFLIFMKRVANFRHLIAHNPIHYCSSTDAWHIFDLKNNENSLSLDEIMSLAKPVDNISSILAAQLRINV